MLESARKLAQIFLWKQLNEKAELPSDLDTWFKQERLQNPQKFFPYLIEDPGKVETVFVIYADVNDNNLAHLEFISIQQFGSQPSEKLPFNMPSGSQSAALGPILKRSYSKEKGAGPSDKIINTTLESFTQKAHSDTPWTNYFKEIISILNRKKLQFGDEIFEVSDISRLLHLAVKKISASKTVFLTVRDQQGRYPGEVPEYTLYLQTILPESKYASLKTPKQDHQTCPLCFTNDVTVYPSACSGAGINISNVDRDGAFPGVSPDFAHYGYALCIDCADLLYIFKFYVLSKLQAYIAGNKALLLPNFAEVSNNQLGKICSLFEAYSDINEKSVNNETNIERLLGAEKAIATIDIIWADFGQKMEAIRGSITDILPSQLKALKEFNTAFEDKKLTSPFHPKHWHDDTQFNLSLGIIMELFKRPGGKAAEKANAASTFWEFKNHFAECIYKRKIIQVDRLWAEAFLVMDWHIKTAIKQDDPVFYLTQEGYSEKKKTTWLTGAGWIRHFEIFLNYLQKLEVLRKMENKRSYEPQWDKLKPFFASESGINSNEKAFAFILGILYGRLMYIQGVERKVNVSANALTYLKNLNLTGNDLPELYTKIRQKLLQYERESKDLNYELGVLGQKLGNQIDLKKIDTAYFLLLGQSMAQDVFKSDSNNQGEN